MLHNYSDEAADVHLAARALLPTPDVSGSEWAAHALADLDQALCDASGLSPVQLRDASALGQALREASELSVRNG